MSYTINLTTLEALVAVIAVIAFAVAANLVPMIYSPSYWGEKVGSAFLEGTWSILRTLNRTDYGGYWASYFVKVVLRNPTDTPVRVVLVALTPKGFIDLVSGASISGSSGVTVTDPPATVSFKGKALYIPSGGYAIILKYTGQPPRNVFYCTSAGCKNLPETRSVPTSDIAPIPNPSEWIIREDNGTNPIKYVEGWAFLRDCGTNNECCNLKDARNGPVVESDGFNITYPLIQGTKYPPLVGGGVYAVVQNYEYELPEAVRIGGTTYELHKPVTVLLSVTHYDSFELGAVNSSASVYDQVFEKCLCKDVWVNGTILIYVDRNEANGPKTLGEALGVSGFYLYASAKGFYREDWLLWSILIRVAQVEVKVRAWYDDGSGWKPVAGGDYVYSGDGDFADNYNRVARWWVPGTAWRVKVRAEIHLHSWSYACVWGWLFDNTCGYARKYFDGFGWWFELLPKD